MRIIPLSIRIKLNVGTLITALFLTIYAQHVCQFIDSVSTAELARNNFLVVLLHIFLREMILYFYIEKQSLEKGARKGYYTGIALWIFSGIVAFLIHYIAYPQFPEGSHMKLLSGYWLLGAGVFAQWEYVVLENAFRVRSRKVIENNLFPEHFSQRLTLGYLLFALVPVFGVIVLITRYVMEDLINPGVAGELAYLTLFYAGVALLVAREFGNQVKNDTNHMVEKVQKIGTGEFQGVLDTSRTDELGKVALGINEMSRGLMLRERIREAFGRFVSPQVAEEFIEKYAKQGKDAERGGERKKLTILVSDIRNFTPLSEDLPPEEITEILNLYFEEMVSAIEANGGIVDKFMGDAVMAVFGLTDSLEKPEINAVNAAIAMKNALKSLNRKYSGMYPVVNNGIGIHCGEVVAGYIGSRKRLEFTVIGQVVNIAARVESKAKAPLPEILVTESIVMNVDDKLVFNKVGDVELKGVSEKVPLYSIDY